jgi:hypothetical protein
MLIRHLETIPPVVDGYPLHDCFHMLDFVAQHTLLDVFFAYWSGSVCACGAVFVMSSGERLSIKVQLRLFRSSYLASF